MDSSNEAQDASQGNQQGQMPSQGQQIAHGTIEGQQDQAQRGQGQQGQQGQTQQGGVQQSDMPQGAAQQGAASVSGQSASMAQRRPEANVGVLRPPVDVIEDAAAITLMADLPGVSKDNLHLRLEAQSLTIEAAMTLDLPAEMEPRHVEVRHHHYERTFALSRELNGEQATAELNHGVLTIRIPKSQDAMPRKIPVNAG